MTLTIELSAGIEAGLFALAKARGLTLPQYLQHLLEEQVAGRPVNLSPAERVAAWRASVEGLPVLPPLSDAAINRESIYGPRG
jgi:hypothetical protein